MIVLVPILAALAGLAGSFAAGPERIRQVCRAEGVEAGHAGARADLLERRVRRHLPWLAPFVLAAAAVGLSEAAARLSRPDPRAPSPTVAHLAKAGMAGAAGALAWTLTSPVAVPREAAPAAMGLFLVMLRVYLRELPDRV